MTKNKNIILAIFAMTAVISLGLVAAAIPFDLDDEDFGIYSHSGAALSGQLNADGSKSNVDYDTFVHDRDLYDGVPVFTYTSESPGTSYVAPEVTAISHAKGVAYVNGQYQDDSEVYLFVE